jgi:cobalt-precorrin-5B (C1)-methyltransferase
MTDRFIYQGNRKLRCGYTTGTCAAAAAEAAAYILLTGRNLSEISITVPGGDKLILPVRTVSVMKEEVCCAVRKDGGDDADVTNGLEIRTAVRKIPEGFLIEGGDGIGVVTKKGLDQDVGEAAVNSIPRKMIEESMRMETEKAGYSGGLAAVVSIPGGREAAKKTFNPRLGIIGGLSVLGTTGIVEPMSERALVETIHAEISTRAAAGEKNLIAVPGNYGADFLRDTLKINPETAVKCSNFIGETIDMGFEFGLESILFVGHIGKLCKLAAGIMNTHSRYADGRMEIMASCALLAGADRKTVLRILECVTTDAAIEVLQNKDILEKTMQVLAGRIGQHLESRACEGLRAAAIVFSNEYGMLCCTEGAEELLEIHRQPAG